PISYEARAFGVHSAMSLMKAAQKAPQAILLPANFAAYQHYSRLFKQAVAELAPHIENRGVDEIYVDVTAIQTASFEIAQQLQQGVDKRDGLSFSVVSIAL